MSQLGADHALQVPTGQVPRSRQAAQHKARTVSQARKQGPPRVTPQAAPSQYQWQPQQKFSGSRHSDVDGSASHKGALGKSMAYNLMASRLSNVRNSENIRDLIRMHNRYTPMTSELAVSHSALGRHDHGHDLGELRPFGVASPYTGARQSDSGQHDYSLLGSHSEDHYGINKIQQKLEENRRRLIEQMGIKQQ